MSTKGSLLQRVRNGFIYFIYEDLFLTAFLFMFVLHYSFFMQLFVFRPAHAIYNALCSQLTVNGSQIVSCLSLSEEMRRKLTEGVEKSSPCRTGGVERQNTCRGLRSDQ